MKCFVRPERAGRAENPHFFHVDGPCLDEAGRPADWDRPGVLAADPAFERLQVNHYFVKSAAQWRQKMARGYHDVVRSGAEFAAYDRNEVEDGAILRFVPATRRIMGEIPGAAVTGAA